jgi:hypothetical protein
MSRDLRRFWFLVVEFKRFELNPAIKRLERTGPRGERSKAIVLLERFERLERPISYGGHVTRAPEFVFVSCYLSIAVCCSLNSLIIIRCAEKRLPQMR